MPNFQLTSPREDKVLPASASTRSGVVFFPRLDIWYYRDGSELIRFDFSFLRDAPELLLGMKATLCWYAENMSPSYTKNGFKRAKHFIVAQGLVEKRVREISAVHLMNYLAKITKDRQWYFKTLGSFLMRWRDFGVAGVGADAVAFLRESSFRGNVKGVAVLTMDPRSGPYTNIEREAIQAALNSTYSQNKIEVGDYLLACLVMMLGQRPKQYANLKVCDIAEERRRDGSATYVLRVPRAKQRGQGARSSFTDRALIPQIGKLLLEYAQMLSARFAKELVDPTQAPLFPVERESSRLPAPPGLQFHHTAQSLGDRIKRVFQKLKVRSERTGQLISVFATRFRRTVGTQAAAEGHGELVIAELLDHSDTSNAGVYVEATPEIVDRIDRAIAMRLAPLAQAFAGVLMDGNVASDVAAVQRIVAPHCSQNFKPVGDCGQHGFCGFAAPVACYTCSNFRAWLDGPHEAVLNYLLAERERHAANTDSRIASVNDRTILAVAQVVNMCKEVKSSGKASE